MKLKTNLKVDEVTKTGRVYPKDAFIVAMENYLSKEDRLGELGQRDDTTINLNNVSHTINSYSIDENNNVFIDVELLNTPSGDILQEYNFSNLIGKFRGIGRVDKEYKVQDLQVVSFDIDLDYNIKEE